MVDGHKHPRQLRDLLELVGRVLLLLVLEIVLLVVNVLRVLLQLGNRVVQLHCVGVHLVLVFYQLVPLVIQVVLFPL